jgi:hypothetical protein
MTFFPDLGTEAMVAQGSHVRAIGWLAAGNSFPTGTVSGEFSERLQRFIEGCGASTLALSLRAYLGWHTCEFCDQFNGSSAFGVPAGPLLYVCPQMLGHYVTVHDYLPPPAFVEALLASPLPETEDYERLAAPFAEAHSRELDGLRARARALRANTPRKRR